MKIYWFDPSMSINFPVFGWIQLFHKILSSLCYLVKENTGLMLFVLLPTLTFPIWFFSMVTNAKHSQRQRTRMFLDFASPFECAFIYSAFWNYRDFCKLASKQLIISGLYITSLPILATIRSYAPDAETIRPEKLLGFSYSTIMQRPRCPVTWKDEDGL